MPVALQSGSVSNLEMLLLLIISFSLMTCYEGLLYKCVVPRHNMIKVVPVSDLRKLKRFSSAISWINTKKLVDFPYGILIKSVLLKRNDYSTAFLNDFDLETNLNRNFPDQNSSSYISSEILQLLRRQAFSILEHLDASNSVENRSKILQFILLLDHIHDFYSQAKYDIFFVYDSAWVARKYSSFERLLDLSGAYSQKGLESPYLEQIEDEGSYLKHLNYMSKHFQEHHIHGNIL